MPREYTKQKQKKSVIVPPSENTLTDKDESITEDLTSMLDDTTNATQISEDDNSFESRIINLEKAIENIQIIFEKHENVLNQILNEKINTEKIYNDKINTLNEKIKEINIKISENNIKNIPENITRSITDNNNMNTVSIEQFAQLQTEFRQYIMNQNKIHQDYTDKINLCLKNNYTENDDEAKNLFKNKTDKIVNDDIKSLISTHYDNHKKDIKELRKDIINLFEELKHHNDKYNIDNKLEKYKENIMTELDTHKKELNSRIMTLNSIGQKKQQIIRRI